MNHMIEELVKSVFYSSKWKDVFAFDEGQVDNNVYEDISDKEDTDIKLRIFSVIVFYW